MDGAMKSMKQLSTNLFRFKKYSFFVVGAFWLLLIGSLLFVFADFHGRIQSDLDVLALGAHVEDRQIGLLFDGPGELSDHRWVRAPLTSDLSALQRKSGLVQRTHDAILAAVLGEHPRNVFFLKERRGRDRLDVGGVCRRRSRAGFDRQSLQAPDFQGGTQVRARVGHAVNGRSVLGGHQKQVDPPGRDSHNFSRRDAGLRGYHDPFLVLFLVVVVEYTRNEFLGGAHDAAEALGLAAIAFLVLFRS
mmetsp:Transcript_29135/g.78842  ORF Transcript_29135/g.78842 Transcript_29135/m.78842 type:complete len:247 (-) Transcript_29135:1156-1896(-)